MSVSVLLGILGWCDCYYVIQYSIYNNVTVFCKKKKKINLETEKFLKLNSTKSIFSIKK